MNADLLRRWLDLPAAPWPPDYYTLLGLRRFEGSAAEVESRAQARIKTLTAQQLRHPDEATEGLTQIARAVDCLTRLDFRQVYDAGLRSQTRATVRPVPTPPPLPVRPPAPAPAPARDPFAFDDSTEDPPARGRRHLWRPKNVTTTAAAGTSAIIILGLLCKLGYWVYRIDANHSRPPANGPLMATDSPPPRVPTYVQTREEVHTRVEITQTDVAIAWPQPKAPTPDKSRATAMLGGAFAPDYFEETGPPGSLLVGFEVGLGKFFNNDVVKALRPVYRTEDKDVLGRQRGTDLSRVTKVVAKPGYAVGAVTIKAGSGLDGITVTFMRVREKEGDLDPKDAYDSDYLGGPGGGGPTRLAGSGRPVIGIIGKSGPKEVNGLGLLFER